ncbi:MAG: T9SS type A sorting domain-containing protein [Saprospiraceae bacterium]
MTHPYAFIRFVLCSLMLFSACLLPAQWEQIPAPGYERVQDVFHVGNSWVALTESGCYRSVNDGLSWFKRPPLERYHESILTVSGSDLYILSHGKGLYHSSNEGQTWTLLTNQASVGTGYPNHLAVTSQYIVFNTNGTVHRYDKFAPSALDTVLNVPPSLYPNFVRMQAQGNELWVTVKDSLLHSNDEGSTWSLVHEGIRATGFGLHDDTLMIATNTSGVQRSTDGGANWSMVFPLNSTNMKIYWDAGQWYLGFYSGNSYTLKSSADGGASWQNSPVPQLQSIYNVKRNGSTLIASTSFGTVRSTDSGNTWEVNNGGFAFDGFNSGGQYRLFAVGNNLVHSMNFSEDQGLSWFKPLNMLSVFNYSQIPSIILHEGSYLTLNGTATQIYRSNGDTRHWGVVCNLPAGTSRILISTGGYLYRLDFVNSNTPGTLFESADKGETWVPTGGVMSTYYTPFGYNGFLYEWRGGYGLFRSQNGGVSWQSIGAGLNSISQFDTPKFVSAGNVLFALGYNEIAASTNNGLTFSIINNNLIGDFGNPMGAINLAYDGSLVVVTTYDDDVYVGQGLNDQWVKINANLPASDFYDAGLAIHNGYIYIDFGYAEQPLWRRPLASLNLAQFDGKVWRDDNNNGLQDSGESNYKGAIVQAGTGSFATTDTAGNYELFADLNNDTLRIKKHAPWVLANPEFYNVTTSVSGKNFGLYFPPDIVDLQVDLTNITVFRPGFKENIYLRYANIGTAEPDGHIRFVANAPLEFETAFPAPDGMNGDTLYWNLQTLAAFSEGHIIVTVKVPASTPLGLEVNAYANITPSQPDVNSIDNQSFLSERVVGSYDPNDKRCDQNNISPEQIAAGEALVFTVRFQNTGTYPAEFVRIADTLDFERLDVSSFQVLASSHPCETTLRGSGAVEFFFDQIDLPPSDFNEPASHGFVKYSIRPRTSLALGQQIRNKAHIYFDYNPAIITNTTLTNVALPVGTHHLGQTNPSQALIISPNPSAGIVEIQTGEQIPGILRVFNTLGVLVLEKSDFSDFEKLDLSSIPSGHYNLEWRSKSGWRKMGKLVKINR